MVVGLVGCSASHTPADADYADTRPDMIDASTDGCLPPANADEIESFLQMIGPAVCDHMQHCAGWSARWTDVTACRSMEPAAWLLAYRPLTLHAINQGRVIFDAEAAAECLGALASCSDPHRAAGVTFLDAGDIGPCGRVFPRRCSAAAGDRCWGLAGDCGSAHRCAEQECMWSGTCAPAAAPGEPCEDASSCAPPDPRVADLALCLGEAERVCRHARVRASVGAGAPCGPRDGVAGGVLALIPCGDGLVCRRDDYLCVPLPGRGEPCVERSCQAPLWCDDGICTDPDVRVEVAVGSRCDATSVCNLQLGTTCVDGTCVRAGVVAGDPCDERPAGRRLWCDPPLVCDLLTETCVADALREDGSDCVFHHECRSACCAVLDRDGVCVSTCAPTSECG